MAEEARFRFTTIAHADRALLGPLSAAAVEGLLGRVSLSKRAARPRVLDIGCGKGEIVLRAMRRLGASGTGVDPNEAFIADARRRAEELGLSDALTLHACALAQAPAPFVPADLAICTGATHAFGDLGAALTGLRAHVRGDGWALVGTGYWRRPPAPGYLALLGAEEGEMPALAGALAAAEAAHWRVEAHHESTLEEWDDYEQSYAGAMRRWLAENPTDGDVTAFTSRIDAWTDGFARWGRDTLGFTTLVLRR